MPEARAAAFERAFRDDYTALVAFCFRRVGDRELAQDLASDAFRIAWTRWDEPRRSTRSWLFGVARNLIGSEYRRRASRPTSSLSAEGREPPDHQPDPEITSIEVRSTLATLRPGDQEVLRLTYWDGLTAAEAAESLGTTTTAVWIRLSRARRAFAHAWQGAPTLTGRPTRTTS